MGKWAKERGLLLANIGLFLAFFGGMILSGANSYSEDHAGARAARRQRGRIPCHRRFRRSHI